jgi:hypothetical protein
VKSVTSFDAAATEMPSGARAAGAAVRGDSEVVKTDAAMIVTATLRRAEESNPLRVNISNFPGYDA